jgi:hypothetical protein
MCAGGTAHIASCKTSGLCATLQNMAAGPQTERRGDLRHRVRIRAHRRGRTHVPWGTVAERAGGTLEDRTTDDERWQRKSCNGAE